RKDRPDCGLALFPRRAPSAGSAMGPDRGNALAAPPRIPAPRGGGERAPPRAESRLDAPGGIAGGRHDLLRIGAPHDRKLALAIHLPPPGLTNVSLQDSMLGIRRRSRWSCLPGFASASSRTRLGKTASWSTMGSAPTTRRFCATILTIISGF